MEGKRGVREWLAEEGNEMGWERAKIETEGLGDAKSVIKRGSQGRFQEK